MSMATNNSPFKFLDSFEANDQESFFGREQEVEEVYSKVFQAKTLLVYGGSGTGKSSIVNCGLAGKFQPSDWLPIHIRRGGNIFQSMANQINKFNLSTPVDDANQISTKEELRALLSSVFLDHFKPIYLIFDQFEELFIFGLSNEWEQFTKTLRYLLKSELELHFIFVLRGEYLEYITEFEEDIPGFFDNRVRIEKMTRTKAKNTITGPCEVAGIKLEEDFEENLLKKLDSQDHRVELTFLQVYLDKIYKNAQGRAGAGPLKFTAQELEELGQLGDVLAEFVDEQIFQMENPKTGLNVLKTFVTLQGTKIPRSPQEVMDELGRRKSALTQKEITATISYLVNRRILRDKDDSGRYELRHDVLASRIFEKISLQEREVLEVQQFLAASYREHLKRGSFLSDDDLHYIAPFEKQLSLSQELQKFISGSKKRSQKMRTRRRNRGILAGLLLLLTLAATAGLFYSQQQKGRADALAKQAQFESAKAQKQKKLAEAERQHALGEKQKAEDQRSRAILAEKEALEQEERAQNALQQVRVEKALAEQARWLAQTNAERAYRQSELAKMAKAKADTLRNLSEARELALQSMQLREGYKKVHLAAAAFQLTEINNGETNSSQIYTALREALESLENEAAFKIGNLNTVIKDMLLFQGQLYLVDETGLLYQLKGSEFKKISLPGVGELVRLKEMAPNQLWALTEEGALLKIDPTTGGISKNAIANREILDFSFYQEQALILTPKKLIREAQDQAQSTELSLPYRLDFITDIDRNGQYWLVSKGGQIRGFDPVANVLTETFLIDENLEITNLALRPLGTELIMGTKDGRIIRWSTKSKKVIGELPGHISAITDLSFAQDEKLISSSFDRSVKIWNLKKPQEQALKIDDLPGWVAALSAEIKGEFYLVTYGGSVFRFPLKAKDMHARICEANTQDITEKHWQELVKAGMSFIEKCP